MRWGRGGENLASQGCFDLEKEAGRESKAEACASVLTDLVLRPEGVNLLNALRTDDTVEIDELRKKLKTQLTSAEVFTALFEPKISRPCALPAGKE